MSRFQTLYHEQKLSGIITFPTNVGALLHIPTHTHTTATFFSCFTKITLIEIFSHLLLIIACCLTRDPGLFSQVNNTQYPKWIISINPPSI